MRKINLFLIPMAIATYRASIVPAMGSVLKEIKKAQEEGQTKCYLSTGGSKMPVEVIEALLKTGYDIGYYAFRPGDWFIRVYWEIPKEKGNIFVDPAFGESTPSTLKEYSEKFM